MKVSESSLKKVLKKYAELQATYHQQSIKLLLTESEVEGLKKENNRLNKIIGQNAVLN